MHSGHDSIGVYLSGATAAGASQKSDAASLGGYRAAERVVCLRWHRYNAITGLRVDYVSPACGAGLGRLRVSSANTARFAAPGDAFGVATRVPVRGFAALRSHNAGDATASQRYCIVSRPSIGDLGGNETLQLMHVVNNAISAGNFSEAESASGAYHYRCVYFRNDSDANVANLKVWLASSDNLAIALEPPTAEYVDAIADESTAPVGPSFTSPTDYATGLAVPTLSPGDVHALWIRTAVEAENTTPEPARDVVIHYANAATSPTAAGVLSGVTRVAVGGIEGYRVWAGEDAEPDYAEPADLELPTLPEDIELTPGHVYYLRAVYRNAYGLQSPPQRIADLRVNAEGGIDDGPPMGPSAVSLATAEGGAILIRAQYLPNLETVARATKWRIYIDDDAAVDVDMSITVGSTVVSLLYTTATTYQDGQAVRVLVRTLRAADGIESENTDWQTVTINNLAPGRPIGSASIGSQFAVAPTPEYHEPSVYWIDEAKGIKLESNAYGFVSFYVGAVLVWRVLLQTPVASTTGPAGDGVVERCFYVPSDWTITDRETVSGDGATDAFDVVAWDPDDRVVALCAAGEYRMLINATSKTITVSGLSDRGPDAAFRPPNLAYNRADGAHLGVWDAALEEMRVAMSTSALDATIRIAAGVDQRYSQAELEAI